MRDSVRLSLIALTFWVPRSERAVFWGVESW
jgi:hypothetical protein